MTSDAAGFVLAGGQSMRMGTDKALASLCGRPLIDHALGILREAGLTPAIAGARSGFTSPAEVIHDDGNGPLSGILAALRTCRAEFAVFLPVDMPLIPASLIGALLHRARVSGAVVTVAGAGGFTETFPAVVHRDTLPALESARASGSGGCLSAFRSAASQLKQELAILPVEWLAQTGQAGHPLGIPSHLWFLNANTPAELARAEPLLHPAIA